MCTLSPATTNCNCWQTGADATYGRNLQPFRSSTERPLWSSVWNYIRSFRSHRSSRSQVMNAIKKYVWTSIFRCRCSLVFIYLAREMRNRFNCVLTPQDYFPEKRLITGSKRGKRAKRKEAVSQIMANLKRATNSFPVNEPRLYLRYTLQEHLIRIHWLFLLSRTKCTQQGDMISIQHFIMNSYVYRIDYLQGDEKQWKREPLS